MGTTSNQPALLGTLNEIDSGWLDDVLLAAGYTARVRNFNVEPIGAGNVSDTARIEIDADGDAPPSVVVKFRPADEALHAHGVGSGAYFRETGAYRLLTAVEGGCRTPVVLWLDGTDDNINLVMEDLSRSTRAGDQVAGCGIGDARAVMLQFARLHRGFFPLTEAQAPVWAIRMAEAGEYWVPVMDRALPVIRQRFGDRLASSHIDLIADAAAVSRIWHDLKHRNMTITHGDPRVDNVLFDAGGGVPEAILIDWQVTGVRNPMHDVGYFLSGSVGIEDRRVAERGLLDLYAYEFAQGGGEAVYDRDAIIADYRIQLISGLMTTAAATALLPDVPAVDQLLLALLERNIAAVEDWDSIAAVRASG